MQLLFVILLALSALLSNNANAGQADLEWTEPTENTDGTPLIDLTSYEIHSGCTVSGVYDNIEVALAPLDTYVVNNLSDTGTCYFAVKATNSEGKTSAFSNEASKPMGFLDIPPDSDTINVTWQESALMARSSVATDNFNRTSLDGNWTQLNAGNGSITIFSSVRVGGSHSQPPDAGMAALWNADSFADDQYAQLVIETIAYINKSNHVGVIVRASTDTGSGRDYYYVTVGGDQFGSNDNTTFGKIVDGTNTEFVQNTDTDWAVTDTLELEAEGTTIRVLRNGVALGGSFTTTDSDLSSGSAGLIGGGADNMTGDDWEGGDITGAAAAAALEPDIIRSFAVARAANY